MEMEFIGTSKYKIGDKFRENGTRGYAWWQIDEIVIGRVEPIYTLIIKPFNSCKMTIGETDLDEKYHKLSK